MSRDAVRWESAAWPRLGKALALWLERSEARVVTVKVAGLKDERHVMRDVSVMVAKILQELAEEERVVIVERRVGTLPPGDSALDKLVWIPEQELKQRLKRGERIIKLADTGRAVVVPLYLFDVSATPSDVIPNFDAQCLIPREAHDPEFVLHCCDFGNSAMAPPAHTRQAKDIVCKVIDGHWNIPFFLWPFCRWGKLLERTQTKKRIQIVDASRYGMTRGGVAPQDYQLFACFPWRNLYVPVESFHSTVIEEFCKEVLDLFGALRAKNATITIRWSDEHNEKNDGRVDAMNCAVEASRDKRANGKVAMSLKRGWPAPTSRPDDPYPLDAEKFFFLAEMSGPGRTVAHGLDLTAARKAILGVKEARVRSGAEIGDCTLELQYSKSDDFELFAKSDQFGEARFASSQKSTLSLTMEYAAQVYEWSAKNKRWQ